MAKITKPRVLRRKKRVSSNILGTKLRPRVSVFVSNIYIYAQMIDDAARKTLASFSSLQLAKDAKYKKDKKTNEARKVGVELSNIAKKNGIKEAIFDRGRYSYNGRVKALAEGLREGGLKI